MGWRAAKDWRGEESGIGEDTVEKNITRNCPLRNRVRQPECDGAVTVRSRIRLRQAEFVTVAAVTQYAWEVNYSSHEWWRAWRLRRSCWIFWCVRCARRRWCIRRTRLGCGVAPAEECIRCGMRFR